MDKLGQTLNSTYPSPLSCPRSSKHPSSLPRSLSPSGFSKVMSQLKEAMKSLQCHPSTRPVSPGTSVSSRGAQPSSDGASNHYQIYSWTRQVRKRMSPIHLCDFLPHPKSALWGHPSGLLVQLSHLPSPDRIPFASSCCSPRLSGPRTLTAGIFPSELPGSPAP